MRLDHDHVLSLIQPWLFSEQLESDLEGERKKLEEARSGIESMRVALQKLNEQVSKREVRMIRCSILLLRRLC